MQRRSNVMCGYVNFPISDPVWENSKEGGMFVKLVVCDNREFDDQFGVCCGVSVTDVKQECLVGDDRRPLPKPADSYESVETVKAEQQAFNDWEGYHFPHLTANDASLSGVERDLSRPYLAVVVMGSTGWSGWHTVEHRSWHCQFDDLTTEGKALYRQLEALYPGCEIHLLTFLDT